MKGERWKDIPGLEMYAKISNYGRFKRLEYELEYSDGRVYIKPEKIIKPALAKGENNFTKDNSYFLRVSFKLFKRTYNFSLARLVFRCFNKPFNLDDKTVIILTKDANGLNIKASNLIMASVSNKQQRIYALNRKGPMVIGDEAREQAKERSKLINSKMVSQYTMKGKKIKTFPSIVIAAKETSINRGRIGIVAGGTEFSAGGFIWRFGKAGTISIKPMLAIIANKKAKKKEAFGKKVTQYEFTGSRVAIYPAIRDAATAIGVSRNAISLVIQKKGVSVGGFYWLEGEGPDFIDLTDCEYGKALRAKKRRKPVQQFSKLGQPLQRFDSLKKAAETVGVTTATLVGALRGRHETAGGFRWKYV